MLEPVVARYRGRMKRRYFRGDAAYVGRPPHRVRQYYASFSYQSASWNKPRRVVAKIEWHPDELYPRVEFIVTDMARPGERPVAF